MLAMMSEGHSYLPNLPFNRHYDTDIRVVNKLSIK